VALILVVYSYCLGSVQLLSPQPRVFGAFLAAVLLPTIARIASDDTQPWHGQLAAILALLFGVTWMMGRTYAGALTQAIELKARTETLAAQLRAEKLEAEAARRSAEAANRAKTQFFAAASHDLRQPLHAMGLFSEALRQRSRDPEVTGLVHSIHESVDALEGLFGELMDITRIDAGGVEARPEDVPLKEVFARLRLHFEPTAFEKGLALTFRGDRHVALADPVLLERVLRNLLSNAIRYTDDGGVLVACRPHAGRLRLQVWDSGIGIPPESLPRIFDEFYQAHGHRPAQAHQRKGMGLGLAIVQRLAGLMGTEATVRSRPGRGSVFSLEVPVGRATRLARPPQDDRAGPRGLTLQGRRIVVVEDEPAVREGLTVLLQTWEATVEAFESLADLQRWLDAGPAAPPDIVIADYRLGSGPTGLKALAGVRAAWPERRIPAIVVSGSTMGGLEDEAQRHDFHLLVKPVLAAKLRAMIAFKLAKG
jgi:signal transduction histidine kinase/CheY-like chemotaxis protein